MARPCSTEMKRTPKKAQSMTRKSNLSILHISQAAGTSIRPMTAVTMMAPKMTLGVYWKSGMRKRSVTITVTAMTMLDTALLQPALWFTADLENAPIGNVGLVN